MARARWEHFAHDADIGVRGIGPSKAEAFGQAATALTAVITDPATVAARTGVEIAGSPPDDTILLIYEMATRRMRFGRFEMTIDYRRLMARACGEAVARPRHQPAVELKSASGWTSSARACSGIAIGSRSTALLPKRYRR